MGIDKRLSMLWVSVGGCVCACGWTPRVDPQGFKTACVRERAQSCHFAPFCRPDFTSLAFLRLVDHVPVLCQRVHLQFAACAPFFYCVVCLTTVHRYTTPYGLCVRACVRPPKAPPPAPSLAKPDCYSRS